MQIVIGLGAAGCNIADKFSAYPQYKTYKIDKNLKGKNCFSVSPQKHPEDYENNYVPIKKLPKEVAKKEILFVLSCGHISGLALRMLEQFKKHNCIINVLYVKPDETLLSQTAALQQKLMFNVMQEYARSAVFKRVYLVDKNAMAQITGKVSLRNYYEKINELLVSTIHMINVFNNSESEIDTLSQPFETARISTIGLCDYESGEEKLFFPLDNVREKSYFYGVNENILDSDTFLRDNIISQLKKNSENGNIKMSYGVFATRYEKSYVYCIAHSSKIQS